MGGDAVVDQCFDRRDDKVWKIVGAPHVKNTKLGIVAKRRFDVDDKLSLNAFFAPQFIKQNKDRDYFNHSQKWWYIGVFDQGRGIVTTTELMEMTLESGRYLK